MSPQNDLEALIYAFSKLPGLGPRSARRVVLHLLRQKEKHFAPLVQLLSRCQHSIVTCAICGNIDMTDPCGICTQTKRDTSIICVVEEVGDLWAMERARHYPGVYHVLGGVLSAVDDRGPEQLRIGALTKRVKEGGVREVIIALGATLEGTTTAHYIAQQLDGIALQITKLAHGIPMGGQLDYLDDGTLAAALNSRSTF